MGSDNGPPGISATSPGNGPTTGVKKWRRDVAMASVFAGNGRSWVPSVMGAAPLLSAVITLLIIAPAALRSHVWISCGVSAVAFGATRALIPVIGAKVPREKRGCDLLKRPAREPVAARDKDVPESLGIVSGVCFVCALVVTQAMSSQKSLDVPGFAHEYASAMLCVVFAVLLGFVDDYLDLEWKYKYALPPLMSLPLLSAYDGGTHVVPPRFCRALLLRVNDSSSSGGGGDAVPLEEIINARSPLGDFLHSFLLRPLFGGGVDETSGAVDLGLLYYIYMVLLAVFCTNAINIYAGVNGLECGQCYVVACAVIAMSAVELARAASEPSLHRDDDDAAKWWPEATKNHLFAVTLALPFAATTLALLRSNWFPARVFVGDTFTNYAGMTLAVVAILGHFPIMLMLLMLPQLANFVLSVPQLFGLRACPRHRLPSYDETTGLLRASRVNDRKAIVPPDKDGLNLTLINAALFVCGPMTEPALASLLNALQVATCAAGLALRFALVGQVY